jgi:hypothetical protein
MINIYNNILSYFIKDIKDNDARAFYEQIKYENSSNIRIFHKDLLIFQITNNYCYKYIDNIITNIDSKFICNYKICCDYYDKYKYLYYKKDKQIQVYNLNYIKFYFTYNKDLKKIQFQYYINNKDLLIVSISYYNRYKFIRINKGFSNKFTSTHILIPNKYELHYYCKLYMILSFVIN